MPYLSFLHFFSTLAYLYLAGFIIVKNWKSPLNRICAIIFFCFALWCLGKTVAHNPIVSQETAFFFMKIVVLGAWSFSGFLLIFSLIFTEQHRLLRKKWIYPLIFAIPLICISEQWLHGSILTYVRRPFGWGLQWQDSIFTLPLMVYFFSSIALSFIGILFFIKRTNNPIKKKQSLIIGLSTLLGFIIGYPTNIILPRLSSTPFPDLGHNMALLWAVGLVYAIVKYRFLYITPKTAAENIISTMADALILTDPEGKIVTVNRAATELLGCGKEETEGKGIDLIIDQNDRNNKETLNLIRNNSVKGQDITFKSKRGETIPVSFSSSLLEGEEKTIAGIVCIARDISDRKMAELEMLKAKELAEKANMAKSEFLANMSHELRTPLNHIIGFNELILDKQFGELNETQEEYLNDIYRSSKHLLSLINDVLDLSKVEAGKLELELTDVPLREVLTNSLVMVKEKALKNGIRLSSEPDGVPETIRADERKLKQILYNLLSNAVKFTPQGGSVCLSAKQMSASDSKKSQVAQGLCDSIEVSVKDTGIGIKSMDLERVFDQFEQAGNPISKKYEGTGLGLSLAKKLVELHKGKIWAESEGEGKGSSFRFVIPI